MKLAIRVVVTVVISAVAGIVLVGGPILFGRWWVYIHSRPAPPTIAFISHKTGLSFPGDAVALEAYSASGMNDHNYWLKARIRQSELPAFIASIRRIRRGHPSWSSDIKELPVIRHSIVLGDYDPPAWWDVDESGRFTAVGGEYYNGLLYIFIDKSDRSSAVVYIFLNR